jgi:hypothetical protein
VKYRVTYTGDRAGRPASEVVEAGDIVDHGHEGEWIDFYAGDKTLVLRVRAKDVERVECVKDEHPAAQTDSPDLSRVLA